MEAGWFSALSMEQCYMNRTWLSIGASYIHRLPQLLMPRRVISMDAQELECQNCRVSA